VEELNAQRRPEYWMEKQQHVIKDDEMILEARGQ